MAEAPSDGFFSGVNFNTLLGGATQVFTAVQGAKITEKQASATLQAAQAQTALKAAQDAANPPWYKQKWFQPTAAALVVLLVLGLIFKRR